jgi:tetratricopeptide (TPR) repeat protein
VTPGKPAGVLCWALACLSGLSSFARTASPELKEPPIQVPFQGEPEVVEAAFVKALAARPDDADLLLQFGDFFYGRGQLLEAKEKLLKAVKLNPKRHESYYLLAMIAQDQGDWPETIRLLERTLQAEPNQPEVWFHLGNLYYLYREETRKVHRWDPARCVKEALKHHLRARDLDPRNATYAVGYAETFYALVPADWAAAEDAWLYCLPISSNTESIYTHLARVSLFQESPAKALRYLRDVHSPVGKRLKEKAEALIVQKK